MQEPMVDLSAALVAALTTLAPVPPPAPLPPWIREFLELRTECMTVDEVIQSKAVWEYVKCMLNYRGEPPTLTIIEKVAQINPVPATDDLPDGW